MTENAALLAALLAAVAANPSDDLPRLVYADWLDENGQPERAEFIRVQMELERLRGRRHEANLREREGELLKAAPEWLGGLDPTAPDCTIVFRRGFPETLAVHGDRLSELADQLHTFGPTLCDVSVVGVRNHGAALARCPLLETVRTLRLEDWPYRHDLEHLARCEHLPKLRHLSWWIGSRQDEAVCRAMNGAGWLPRLDSLELIRLHEGATADGSAEDLDANATRCRTLCDRARGVTITAVTRAFDTEFTIPERVGLTVYAGTIKGSQRVLICAGRDPIRGELRLLSFDSAGHFRDIEYLDSWSMGSVYSYLGFRPGSIRLRAFDVGMGSGRIGVRKFSDGLAALIADPDAPVFRDPLVWFGHVSEVRSQLRSSAFYLDGGPQRFRVSADGECVPLT